ncbi:hypothetical protein TSAR_011637 [Trichomalopsis sarcophagae]|uniref:Uncharacterized protein n=1 Tax=Trichomalopsis sarcophagae TaxID=543379 RepID=A0A232EPG5_9HYME|nr:hypothetical protein TSAR_011637 [Trichomalopsis sarcophagae]
MAWRHPIEDLREQLIYEEDDEYDEYANDNEFMGFQDPVINVQNRLQEMLIADEVGEEIHLRIILIITQTVLTVKIMLHNLLVNRIIPHVVVLVI